MEVEVKKFDELKLMELYDILALRTDIFVVEQECAYRELDFYDQKALHILGSVGGELVAYARILPEATAYEVPSIGRFAVTENKRRQGFGRKTFEAALAQAKEAHPGRTIKIQAQCYLEKFYENFGFQTISAPYPDYGIMHIDMIYSS